jgi:predicted DsbA family dithiol-disulfide isomerase
MKVTYYLDVISSWCFWAEPGWAELKQGCAGQAEFVWKIALLDAPALPVSREQEDWFYRRSGTIVRSPFMLNSRWFDPELKEYVAPNFVAEAAKDFGVTDDRVRLAIARAGLREGRRIGRWDESAAIAAQAAGLDATALLARAKNRDLESRVRTSTAEFRAFQINQRPAFFLENRIGDRAIFSGLVSMAPLVATIEAMLHDAAAYASHTAHYGKPPVE